MSELESIFLQESNQGHHDVFVFGFLGFVLLAHFLLTLSMLGLVLGNLFAVHCATYYLQTSTCIINLKTGRPMRLNVVGK